MFFTENKMCPESVFPVSLNCNISSNKLIKFLANKMTHKICMNTSQYKIALLSSFQNFVAGNNIRFFFKDAYTIKRSKALR